MDNREKEEENEWGGGRRSEKRRKKDIQIHIDHMILTTLIRLEKTVVRQNPRIGSDDRYKTLPIAKELEVSDSN